MKPLILTDRQTQVLDLLCELGDTKLVAHRMGVETKSVHDYISRAVKSNGHINRLTLALAWDRQKRSAG